MGGLQIGDEEHQLIARYAKQLARQEQHLMAMESIDPNSAGRHALIHSRQLVKDLEKKNREIMRNIHQLREQSRQQQQRFGHLGGAAAAGNNEPSLLSELEELRVHKDDLEVRLSELQSTRRDLMQELQELMKLLKVDPYGGQASAMSVPQSSDHLCPPSSGANHLSANNSVTDVSGLGLESGSNLLQQQQLLFSQGRQQQQPQQQQPSYGNHQKLLPMVYIDNDGSILVDESYRGGGLSQQQQQQLHQQQHYMEQQELRMMQQHYDKQENTADSPGSLSE
jgi:hypothetical protein